MGDDWTHWLFAGMVVAILVASVYSAIADWQHKHRRKVAWREQLAAWKHAETEAHHVTILSDGTAYNYDGTEWAPMPPYDWALDNTGKWWDQ